MCVLNHRTTQSSVNILANIHTLYVHTTSSTSERVCSCLPHSACSLLHNYDDTAQGIFIYTKGGGTLGYPLPPPPPDCMNCHVCFPPRICLSSKCVKMQCESEGAHPLHTPTPWGYLTQPHPLSGKKPLYSCSIVYYCEISLVKSDNHQR